MNTLEIMMYKMSVFLKNLFYISDIYICCKLSRKRYNIEVLILIVIYNQERIVYSLGLWVEKRQMNH